MTRSRADFTALALDYAQYRSGYSGAVADALVAWVFPSGARRVAADVGAGTGIWSRMVSARGVHCIAVEPNESMRRAGAGTADAQVEWRAGSAEQTTLEPESVRWVTMASAFHWADPEKALREFARILEPGGFVSVLWNPRDLEASPLEQEVEEIVRRRVPELRRVSSGSALQSRQVEQTLQSTREFGEVVHMEGRHTERMTPDRYLGLWRSVRDVQTQAGPERFAAILDEIAQRIAGLGEVLVPYLTRAWTARKLG